MFGRREGANIVTLRPEGASPHPSEPAAKPAAPEVGRQAGACAGRDGEAAPGEVMMVAMRLAHPEVSAGISLEDATEMARADLARRIAEIVCSVARRDGIELQPHEQRDVVTALLNELLIEAKRQAPAQPTGGVASSRASVEDAKKRVQPMLMERIDVAKASELPRAELARQIGDIVAEILGEERMQLNRLEQRDLITTLLHDMLGLGPLEPLLADEAVTDIMVNGPRQVYVERRGKLELTDIAFRDDAHVMNIATRIVSRIGRRIDESTPLVDARLHDGSRVNIIIPPLAIDGPSISIRKFAKQEITLETMERQCNLSAQMATFLKVVARCRLNILISGGTGSGKTTLLNAMSRMVDDGERIVTIEDAAELQLQQPHVVRLETRPANLEGDGQITQRELVRNTLRMRPDRIILGEIRGGEALDMLQAMNTGHDGSMCTIHANRPREALTRLENMVAMSGVKLASEAVRAQIAGAVNLIVQVARMRDGIRRITQITEVVGMEGKVVTTQDLFTFEYEGEDADGRLLGTFKTAGLRPHCMPRAEYYGLGRALVECMA